MKKFAWGLYEIVASAVPRLHAGGSATEGGARLILAALDGSGVARTES
jgi:hypothetical protein